MISALAFRRARKRATQERPLQFQLLAEVCVYIFILLCRLHHPQTTVNYACSSHDLLSVRARRATWGDAVLARDALHLALSHLSCRIKRPQLATRLTAEDPAENQRKGAVRDRIACQVRRCRACHAMRFQEH